jgi:hypothetical protein
LVPTRCQYQSFEEGVFEKIKKKNDISPTLLHPIEVPYGGAL